MATINKFIAKLPGSKNYTQLPQSPTSEKFIWEDKGSPLVRIQAPVAYPWEQEWVILRSFARGKSDQADYAQKLALKCFPIEDNPADLSKVLITREVYKSKFPYSQAPTLFVAAFPHTQDLPEFRYQWLMYSVYLI